MLESLVAHTMVDQMAAFGRASVRWAWDYIVPGIGTVKVGGAEITWLAIKPTVSIRAFAIQPVVAARRGDGKVRAGACDTVIAVGVGWAQSASTSR